MSKEIKKEVIKKTTTFTFMLLLASTLIYL